MTWHSHLVYGANRLNWYEEPALMAVPNQYQFSFTWIEDCTPSSVRRICRSGLGRGTWIARQRKLGLWVGRVSNSWPSPPSLRWQRPELSGRRWPQPLRTSQTWRWCRQTGKGDLLKRLFFCWFRAFLCVYYPGKFLRGFYSVLAFFSCVFF